MDMIGGRDVVTIGGCGCGHDRRSSVVMIGGYTVKPLITDPPKSGQPLYSRQLHCPRLILP